MAANQGDSGFEFPVNLFSLVESDKLRSFLKQIPNDRLGKSSIR